MTKSVLDRAKAFLCWDAFPGLSIQLVAMRETVSYYYPPAAGSSIILFYDAEASDFTRPLFNLFHEAGHHAEFIRMKAENREENFEEVLDAPTGPLRTDFEKSAWEEGRRLLMRLIDKEQMDRRWIEAYDAYATQCITTYDEGSP